MFDQDHPEIQKMRKSLTERNVYWCQHNEVWYMLCCGIFGNPNEFCLVWGKERKQLYSLMRHTDTTDFFVRNTLWKVVCHAQEILGIDLLTMDWKVEYA